MWIGLCWPRPGEAFDPHLLLLTKEYLGANVTLLRFDADYRDGYSSALTQQVLDAGWIPLPVLDIDYPGITRAARTNDFDDALWPFLDHAIRLAETFGLPAIEVLNEPRIMAETHGGAMTPNVYAAICNAVGDEYARRGLSTKVIAAGDMLQPDRKGPRPIKWWEEAWMGLNSELYYGVAVHPYREPGKPSVSRFSSREAEFAWIHAAAGGKPVWVTETGWRVGSGGVTEAQQADYLAQELAYCETGGAEGVCVYAHTGEWGLFEEPDFRPRAAVARVRDFADTHQGV